MRTFVSSLMILALALVFATSCNTAQNTKSNVSMVNTRWKLEKLNGKKVDLPMSGKEIFITLKLNSSNFDGFAGCNGIRGQYEANIDGTVNFSKIISTMMACDVLETESAFVQALESATTYKVNGDEMTLFADGKAIAQFYAVYLR